MHDQIDLAQVRSALVGTRFAAHLRHFPTVASTNTLLLEAAAAGAPEGTVYIADEQTAGRGRGSHAWHSTPGDGLYLSLLIRPALRLHDALLLSLATGLAVQQAVLEITGVSLDLRWPNDLMLRDSANNPTRKLGGILLETAVEPGDNPLLRYAVIGIGLNVHHATFPPDLADQATSLHLATTNTPRNSTQPSPPLARAPLLIAILRRLDLELLDLEGGSPATRQALLARFTAASTWVCGKRVHVPEQDGYTGTTAGLDPRGFLLVDAGDGRRRTVLSGGVRQANQFGEPSVSEEKLSS